MNIFSEIYGVYFDAAEKILSEKNISENRVNEIITEKAFRDSLLFIPDKIIPKKNGYSPWGLLKRNDDGTISPVIQRKPEKRITLLQKRWLKSKLNDPKIKLFIDDETIYALSKRLENVTPLYDLKIFRFFDEFTDGDDYENEDYRKHFRKILSSVNTGEIIFLKYISRNNNIISGNYLPLKIEYSRKNDKFRLLCMQFSDQKISERTIINIGRITDSKKTGIFYNDNNSIEKYFYTNRCHEPVVVEVSSERNGIERFMMEFASFEKRAELDLETEKCKVYIWYSKQDETELLIMLLSFGPVIKILGPADFKSKAAERVKKQYELILPLLPEKEV